MRNKNKRCFALLYSIVYYHQIHYYIHFLHNLLHNIFYDAHTSSFILCIYNLDTANNFHTNFVHIIIHK